MDYSKLLVTIVTITPGTHVALTPLSPTLVFLPFLPEGDIWGPPDPTAGGLVEGWALPRLM